MNSLQGTLKVERGSPRHPDVVRMIIALDAYLAELYPAESNHLTDVEALSAPDVLFFVARLDEEVVGCGAPRLHPAGYGELKRMFVGPHARGKNVGRAILRRLEQEAGVAKLNCVRLETGTRQAEALGLYRSAGYCEIPPFGDYQPDPLSVFMEKRLEADEQGGQRTGLRPAADRQAVGKPVAMSWEVDHVFFASVDADAVEAELAALGFAFTVRCVHPGQGTANACAAFENAFFEVLRSRDREELDSDLVRPLGLAERIRWRETGACPFGLCFRPTDAPSDPGSWPFETWQYAPPYVPSGTSIPIVTPRYSLSEPLVFISNRPNHSLGTSVSTSPTHSGAHRTLTNVRVHRPTTSADSAGVRWFAEHEFFSLKHGPEFLLELQLGRGSEARTHNFQPHLPLAIRL